MPGMNGLDLVRRIKYESKSPRVAMISVHDEVGYREAARTAGAEGFIAKSEFTWQVLLAIRDVAEQLRAAETPPEPAER